MSNTFQPIVAFQIETSDFICSSKQMNGFHIKWVDCIEFKRGNEGVK